MDLFLKYNVSLWQDIAAFVSEVSMDTWWGLWQVARSKVSWIGRDQYYGQGEAEAFQKRLEVSQTWGVVGST